MNKGYEIKSVAEKYINGNCTREELERAMTLFEDPHHHLELFPMLYEIWNNDDSVFQSHQLENELSLILHQVHHQINLCNQPKKNNRIRKYVLTISKIAAILIIGLLLGISLQYLKKSEPVYYTSVAPKGSVSQLILPDQSMVYLNAGSELKYSAVGSNGPREVFLVGEGWFDVAKNEKKPFIVHTPSYDIHVTGTQFNVKAYQADDEFVTTLEEGTVQITSSENMKMKGTQELRPGEQLIYHKQKNVVEINNVNTRMFTSWKDNKLIFINMNLKELIVLLERKYGVDIKVTDNVILDYHYDGTIKDETILEVLDLLKETLPVKYKIEGQTILITK